jgi:hypothetical protein
VRFSGISESAHYWRNHETIFVRCYNPIDCWDDDDRSDSLTDANGQPRRCEEASSLCLQHESDEPHTKKRHTEVLSPVLRSAKLSVNELTDGYAFQFPSDAKTYQTVAEWVGNERLCCPFFDFDIRVGDESAPMSLRITGPDGVKQFIKAELAGMVG